MIRNRRNDGDEFRFNRELYNSPAEASQYAAASELQPAEKLIIDILRKDLPDMKMLDVGVGGGRTTKYFAPLVGRYLGLDYAPAMADACRRQYPQFEFMVADACELSDLSSNSFDFILFSYNGLDYVNHQRRQEMLEGFRRLLRPGGYLGFSSHNTLYLPRLACKFRLNLSGNPRRIAGSVKRRLLFQFKNRSVKISPDLLTAVVFEGNYGFKAPTFYIRPDYQVDVLRNLGMENIRVFPNESGTEVFDRMALTQIPDAWVYYLCHKRISVSDTLANHIQQTKKSLP